MKSAPPKHISKLAALICQNHLLDGWESLTPSQKQGMGHQLSKLDLSLFQKQKAYLENKLTTTKPLQALSEVYSFTKEHELVGKKLIEQNKCACVIAAGGQGSRLKSVLPKGCMGITSVKQKSLFQIICEKLKAASKLAGLPLEVAIMTSPLNHAETELYFYQNHYFGLNPTQVHFFQQEIWPLLDMKGDLFFESPGKIAMGPNGNGGIFRRLAKSGLLQKWKDKGIEYISYIPIDNPLADPFHLSLLGFHHDNNCDITMKAVQRENQEEKVGVFAHVEGQLKVIEYSEIPEEEKRAIDVQSGLLKHRYANLSLFCFSRSFIETAALETLPLHASKKPVPTIDFSQKSMIADEPNAWKYEEFIFDLLPIASKAKIVVCKREEAFAPLKNSTGQDSIATVQAALRQMDRITYFKVTGILPSQEAFFELSQDFYYPTSDFLKRWHGKPLPSQAYIEDL